MATSFSAINYHYIAQGSGLDAANGDLSNSEMNINGRVTTNGKLDAIEKFNRTLVIAASNTSLIKPYGEKHVEVYSELIPGEIAVARKRRTTDIDPSVGNVDPKLSNRMNALYEKSEGYPQGGLSSHEVHVFTACNGMITNIPSSVAKAEDFWKLPVEIQKEIIRAPYYYAGIVGTSKTREVHDTMGLTRVALHIGGAESVPNTGPHTIYAGDLLCWDVVAPKFDKLHQPELPKTGEENERWHVQGDKHQIEQKIRFEIVPYRAENIPSIHLLDQLVERHGLDQQENTVGELVESLTANEGWPLVNKPPTPAARDLFLDLQSRIPTLYITDVKQIMMNSFRCQLELASRAYARALTDGRPWGQVDIQSGSYAS